jgi:hypothetical protein
MKKLIMILCLLSVNAMAGEYDMKCDYIKRIQKNKFNRLFTLRCENNEAICYGEGTRIVSCFKK